MFSTFGTAMAGFRRPLLWAVLGLVAVAAPTLTFAADVHRLDIVVHETIPATHGVIVRGRIEGCPSASVRTIRAGSSQRIETSFNGSKKFNCGSGNTLTLAFRVTVSGCSANNKGVWKVTRGTGIFFHAEGEGTLKGSYTSRGGPGTSCNADGIDDHYTGTLEY